MIIRTRKAAYDCVWANRRGQSGIEHNCRSIGQGVTLSTRRYLRYTLSLRDLVAMAERGLSMVYYTTIMRWVEHCTPRIRQALEPFRHARGFVVGR